jgi:hypothetical protein
VTGDRPAVIFSPETQTLNRNISTFTPDICPAVTPEASSLNIL